MTSPTAPSQTILNLARAVNELIQARERFRVASMPDEKDQCQKLAKRLLGYLELLTEDAELPNESKVVGRYSEEELDERCTCGHSRRAHLISGDGSCAIPPQGSTRKVCTCQGFVVSTFQ